jgi:glycosyltransferase involved in cell wall biosynthesis
MNPSSKVEGIQGRTSNRKPQKQSVPRRSTYRFALLGCYPPRLCGIATFTQDLAIALSERNPDLVVESIAMSDRNDYRYPSRVCREIDQNDPASYISAAGQIRDRGYDVLSVQHEYGIFGGPAGSYLMNLVREVKIPIVTTLHSVLREPTRDQRDVMDELLQLSERVVVMSRKAIEFLCEIYGVRPHKIDLIPHGIPRIPNSIGWGLRAKPREVGPTILTFGLLSPDKGIEYVIAAMPTILREHPSATYTVVGATHPRVRESAGESYREYLMALTHQFGVASNVRFVNRFVTNEELVAYLGAMDIYITPYLNPSQITSGTLAYAVGAGKPVISTPYWYAEELLAEGRGLLVPFRNASAVAQAILSVQRCPAVRLEMGRRAAAFGEQMLWSEVGKAYLASLSRAMTAGSEIHKSVATSVETNFAGIPQAQLR